MRSTPNAVCALISDCYNHSTKFRYTTNKINSIHDVNIDAKTDINESFCFFVGNSAFHESRGIFLYKESDAPFNLFNLNEIKLNENFLAFFAALLFGKFTGYDLTASAVAV